MEKTFIGVRDVDEATFRKFRALAVSEKIKLGEALNLAMKKLLAEKESRIKHDVRNLDRITGIFKTKGKVRWSEEIDKTLYGK